MPPRIAVGQLVVAIWRSETAEHARFAAPIHTGARGARASLHRSVGEVGAERRQETPCEEQRVDGEVASIESEGGWHATYAKDPGR